MEPGNFSLTQDLEPASSSSWVEKWLFPRIYRAVGPAPVRLVLGEGAGITPPHVTPRFRMRIRDVRTVMELLLDPEVGFGDAFSDGRVQVTGDLSAFLEAVYASMAQVSKRPGWYSRLISVVTEAWQANTLEGSRHNVHAHYDLGNDFYRLWLDSRLVYTCAYFPTPDATLEDAQIAKMDYICRKLRLQPGETVIESGCGWGSLALHMARHYGVRVRAFNISREQIRYAQQRAREEQLAGQVEFIEDDYRNASGKFDAFVSVGMLEHVGREHYQDLGALIHRSIGDSGRGLLHFIGRSEQCQFSRWIRKRIFPGAYAPSLREALQVLEPHGYFVNDVENLRRHYARTLALWLTRFDQAAETVRTMYDAEFERAWRLYLAGSLAGFSTGTLQLFQVVFSGAGCAPVPDTRAALYAAQR